MSSCTTIAPPKDLQSLTVSRNNEDHPSYRIKESWILIFEPGSKIHFKETVMYLGSHAIRIEFPNHATASPHYRRNLEKFRKEYEQARMRSTTIAPIIGNISLASRATTQAPSDVHTPRRASIYYRHEKIGPGAFGEIYRVIRQRDGCFFAAERFVAPSKKRKHGELDPEWFRRIKREFLLMRDNPHVRDAPCRFL